MQVRRLVCSTHRVTPCALTSSCAPVRGSDPAGRQWVPRGDPLKVAATVRSALGTPNLIPTRELRELVTMLERLQDELRSRSTARADRPRAAHWFQRGEALLGGQVREVLEHLKVGRSEKEIARAMGRSPHTVHSHVKTIYRHFNVSSRSELLALWVQVA